MNTKIALKVKSKAEFSAAKAYLEEIGVFSKIGEIDWFEFCEFCYFYYKEDKKNVSCCHGGSLAGGQITEEAEEYIIYPFRSLEIFAEKVLELDDKEFKLGKGTFIKVEENYIQVGCKRFKKGTFNDLFHAAQTFVDNLGCFEHEGVKIDQDKLDKVRNWLKRKL